MTTIAVLIPTYNGSPHIATALRSVIEAKPQTYGIQAVYISDDRSTDDTLEIAKTCWNDETKLVIIEAHQNQGLYANHNHGLRALLEDGVDWVLILHQDDYVHTNWFSVMAEHIHSCPSNVVSICSSYNYFFDDGRVVDGENSTTVSSTIINGSPKTISDTIRSGCWWHISGCAIRMSAFEQVGLFDPGLPHWADWDWIMRCMAAQLDILYIPQSLMGWRQHDASYSSTSIRTVYYTRQQIEVVERFSKFISKGELLQWHRQQLGFAFRRLGRALLTGNRKYAQASMQTLALLVQNTFRSVRKN